MKLLQCRVGLILATMDPHDPQSSLPAEADIIFQSFKATKPAYIWASPRFIEVSYVTLSLEGVLTVILFAGMGN